MSADARLLLVEDERNVAETLAERLRAEGFQVTRADSLASALAALFFVGFVPLAGLLFLPWVIETRGRQLAD